jgi:hypothetical protein
VIVNRTWPAELATELADIELAGPSAAFVSFAQACLRAQADVIAAAAPLCPTRVVLPSASALALAQRGALADLGGSLLHALSPALPELRRAS